MGGFLHSGAERVWRAVPGPGQGLVVEVAEFSVQDSRISRKEGLKVWGVNRKIRATGVGKMLGFERCAQLSFELYKYFFLKNVHSIEPTCTLIEPAPFHMAFYPSFTALALPWRNCIGKILLVDFKCSETHLSALSPFVLCFISTSHLFCFVSTQKKELLHAL